MHWKQDIVFNWEICVFLLNSFSWSYNIELKNIWYVVATSVNHDASGEISAQTEYKKQSRKWKAINSNI